MAASHFVPTRASQLLNLQPAQLEVVKFESYKPKQHAQKRDKLLPAERKPLNTKQELDLKKIRHDIVKFGMSGFSGTKKEEAKIALAISLGAKPPKKEYKNYKQLMEERKQAKQKDEEEKALQLLGRQAGLKALQNVTKKNKKGNDVGKLLNVYGKVDKKELEKNKTPTEKKKKSKRKF